MVSKGTRQFRGTKVLFYKVQKTEQSGLVDVAVGGFDRFLHPIHQTFTTEAAAWSHDERIMAFNQLVAWNWHELPRPIQIVRCQPFAYLVEQIYPFPLNEILNLPSNKFIKKKVTQKIDKPQVKRCLYQQARLAADFFCAAATIEFTSTTLEDLASFHGVISQGVKEKIDRNKFNFVYDSIGKVEILEILKDQGAESLSYLVQNINYKFCFENPPPIL